MFGEREPVIKRLIEGRTLKIKKGGPVQRRMSHVRRRIANVLFASEEEKRERQA